jgi:serine/threonine protein kinase
VYITDFGLARLPTDAGMTMTGDLIGTLRYMSPEQALAKRITIDHRTDIYSLGITLYELLTLQPAFTASDRQTLLRQIATDDPPAPRKAQPHHPRRPGNDHPKIDRQRAARPLCHRWRVGRGTAPIPGRSANSLAPSKYHRESSQMRSAACHFTAHRCRLSDCRVGRNSRRSRLGNT